MRRVYMPGGGWILLAACAVPFLVSMAKPAAKKIGKGLKTMGEKLMEAVEQEATAEPEAPGAQAKPSAKKESKPRSQPRRKRPAPKKPEPPSEA